MRKSDLYSRFGSEHPFHIWCYKDCFLIWLGSEDPFHIWYYKDRILIYWKPWVFFLCAQILNLSSHNNMIVLTSLLYMFLQKEFNSLTMRVSSHDICPNCFISSNSSWLSQKWVCIFGFGVFVNFFFNKTFLI